MILTTHSVILKLLRFKNIIIIIKQANVRYQTLYRGILDAPRKYVDSL